MSLFWSSEVSYSHPFDVAITVWVQSVGFGPLQVVYTGPPWNLCNEVLLVPLYPVCDERSLGAAADFRIAVVVGLSVSACFFPAWNSAVIDGNVCLMRANERFDGYRSW